MTRSFRYAILAALHVRDRSGRGQHVDIAMSDGVLYLLASVASQYFGAGQVIRPGESMLNGAMPHYNVYETKDERWVSVGSLEPHFFANLCRVLGCEEYIPHQGDASKREEIFAHFRKTFKTKTRDEWFQILQETDICAAPVYSFDEALQDRHNRHRQMVVEVSHPKLGKVKQIGIGPKFSETPGKVRHTAPLPGDHTDGVLASLGYSSAEIAALRQARVVA